jgi:hypothetical protein
MQPQHNFVCVLIPRLGNGQEAKAVLAGVAKAMGDVKMLQYTGSGSTSALVQSPSPETPWPRFNAKSYSRSVNYDTASRRAGLKRVLLGHDRYYDAVPRNGKLLRGFRDTSRRYWCQTRRRRSGETFVKRYIRGKGLTISCKAIACEIRVCEMCPVLHLTR